MERSGKIEKVVEATEDVEGYLLVTGGQIFKTDIYIPLDAVVKRSGTDVFINIPKLVTAMMPWGNLLHRLISEQSSALALRR